MGTSSSEVRPEARIAALAAQQFGRVHRRQLRAAGLSDGQITGRAAAGWLLPRGRGVFAVGHVRDDRWARWSEVALMLGPGTLLSHTTAATLWKLRWDAGEVVHVTVPSARKAPFGVVLHRSAGVVRAERDGLAVTTLARTLRDACAVTPPREHDEMLHQADQRWRIGPREVEEVLGRGRHGSTALRRALAERLPAALMTRSRLERVMLRIVAGAGLPAPLVNATVAGLEVDFLWPRQRVIAEVDTPAFHGDRRAMRSDRERDVHLRLHGYQAPLRFLDEHLERRPAFVAGALRAVLGSAPAAKIA